jgi:hypothetical protein
LIDLPVFLAVLLTEHTAIIGGRELQFANRRSTAIRHTDFLTHWSPFIVAAHLGAEHGNGVELSGAVAGSYFRGSVGPGDGGPLQLDHVAAGR